MEGVGVAATDAALGTGVPVASTGALVLLELLVGAMLGALSLVGTLVGAGVASVEALGWSDSLADAAGAEVADWAVAPPVANEPCKLHAEASRQLARADNSGIALRVMGHVLLHFVDGALPQRAEAGRHRPVAIETIREDCLKSGDGGVG